MKVSVVFAVALIATIALITPVRAIAGTLGVAQAITANTELTIDFITGEQLVITSNTAGTVTVTVAVSAGPTLPTGYANLAAAIRYTITHSVSTATITSGTFKTISGSVTTALIAAVGGSIPGVLYFDATANAYMDVSVPQTITNNQVSFAVPYFGTYYILALSASIPRPAIYGRITVVPNDQTARSYIFDAATTTPFGLSVASNGATGSVSNLIVSSAVTTTGTAPAAANIALGSFYTVAYTGATSFSASMNRTYTAAEVATKNINPATLRFAVNNGGQFTLRDTGFSVDTTTRVVTQSTTSFSEWGVYGAANAAGTAVVNIASFALLAVGAVIAMYGF